MGLIRVSIDGPNLTISGVTHSSLVSATWSLVVGPEVLGFPSSQQFSPRAAVGSTNKPQLGEFFERLG